jgi:hypothetical protein
MKRNRTIPAPLAGLAAVALVLAVGTALATDEGGTDLPAAALAAASDGAASPPAGTDEDLSGPCDEAEHAGDARCAAVPPPPAAPGIPATPAGATRSFSAGPGGTVSYVVDDGGFGLVAATPAAGWVVDVEQAAGTELDLDFRRGTVRVQVDVELEDGQVRERVRVRDDATDERTEAEVFVPAAPVAAGTPTPPPPVPSGTDDDGGDVDRDDRHESGDDRDDGSSGPGSGQTDDDGSSGPGGDDGEGERGGDDG